MIASSWLRKVSNTCSSHARRNRFNAVDNGSVTRTCLLSGGWSWEALVTTTAGAFPHLPVSCLMTMAPPAQAVPERDRALRPRGIPFYDVGARPNYQNESMASAESQRGIPRATLELRTSFELQATHRWAAQLYLHPTTDRLGSPAPPPSTVPGTLFQARAESRRGPIRLLAEAT
jgi:hypothetical protein